CLPAEGAPRSLAPGVCRREPARPAGEPLLARVLDVVIRRVDLVGARERVVAAPVVRAEAARGHLPDVQARDSLNDPLGDELSHPPCAGEAVRTESGRDPEATYGGLSEHDNTARGGSPW